MENKAKELKEITSRLSVIAQELSEQVEPKQPFKDGDVVENPENKCIVKIVNIKENIAYGLNYEGEWKVGNFWDIQNNINNLQLSTPKKWLEVCTKEAEKIYKVGDKIQRPDNFINSGIATIVSGYSTCFLSDNKFQFHGVQVMQDGIWATVLASDKTLEELDKEFFLDNNFSNYIEWMKANSEAYIKALQNLKK